VATGGFGVTLPAAGAWPVETDAADLLGSASVDLLRRRAVSTPQATAIVDADTGEATTYAAFDRAVGRLAGALDGVDAPCGRVGVVLDTGRSFARTYFAVARLGGTVVPLDVNRPESDLADRAARAGVELVVCDRETEPTARGLGPAGVPVASVDDSHHESTLALEKSGSAGEPVAVAPDAERLVMFTSGTTGTAKGVRLTFGNLVASAVGSARRLGVESGDRWLVPLPMYHMGGLAPLVRSTLYGTTTVLQREFDARATARALGNEDATGTSMVPTMLKRLLEAGWTPDDRLRFVLLGGAPASRALLERALERDVPVFPTYGTTETASQVATATPVEVADHPGTVGRPLANTGVSVLDDGTPVEAGQSGELVVSGPTVSPGYLDADRSAAAFGSEGFHTGDLGHGDEAGRLWVLGRLDDRIVTGGENVSPASVAEALESHDSVAEAAVVGLPDEEWGQRVAALVVPEGTAVDREAVLTHARGRLAPYAVPKTLAVTDGLPRTASGTVDREAVREALQQGE